MGAPAAAPGGLWGVLGCVRAPLAAALLRAISGTYHATTLCYEVVATSSYPHSTYRGVRTVVAGHKLYKPPPATSASDAEPSESSPSISPWCLVYSVSSSESSSPATASEHANSQRGPGRTAHEREVRVGYLLPPLPLRSTRPLPHQRQNLLDLRCVATGSEPTTRVVAVRVVAGHTYPGQAAPPARLIAFGAWLRAAASGPVRVGRAAAMRQRAANASTALTVAREQLCRERLAFAAGRSADVVGQPRPGQRVAALLVLVGVPREICAQRASSLSAKAGPASPRLRGRRRHGWRAGCFCGPHLRAQTGSAAARRTVSCGGSAESRDSA